MPLPAGATWILQNWGIRFYYRGVLLCPSFNYGAVDSNVGREETQAVRQEQDVCLVAEKGGAYVCSRHFTSEDYILGCSDSRLNPGAVPSLSSSKKGSLFTSHRTNRSLYRLWRSGALHGQTSGSSLLCASHRTEGVDIRQYFADISLRY